MKFEWRKHAKELYMAKEKVELLTVTEFKFFMLKGKGNPNHEQFSEAVGVLYSLSYAVKMMIKNGAATDEYFDYTVFPLEGVWDLSEKGKLQENLDKDELLYTLMIRQPDFITKEIAMKAIEMVKKKKPHPLLDDIIFDTMIDGPCVQMLHVGSYDDEIKSFEIMKEYCTENNLERISKVHREIYISDARKTEKDKLKTVLRYQVSYK
jgi:hypothetical protein